MSDLNQFTCTGRLGADPEKRTFPDGKPIVNLRVAVSDTWKDRATGERKENTLWMGVAITSEGLCKIAEQYLKKGSKVALSGSLRTRKWTDQSGAEKQSTEMMLTPFHGTLVMLDTAGSSSGRTPDFDSGNAGSTPAPATTIEADDLPF